MMAFLPDYDYETDYWCPDCGFPPDLCACDDDVPYWEWAEDEWFDAWLFSAADLDTSERSQ